MDVGDSPVTLAVDGVQALVAALRDEGRTVVGPTVRDSAITLAEITTLADLPVGVGDEQSPGRYRLRARDDGAFFGYAAAATSPKRLFFPPEELIVSGGGLDARSPAEGDGRGDHAPLALVGMRSCDLHALAALDQALLRHGAVDVRYASRRRDAFVIAVTCTEPGGTCFCAGLGTGPEPLPGTGYDIRLTELLDGGHRFVAVADTPEGAGLLARVPHGPARTADLAAAADAVASAAGAMRCLPDADRLTDDLYAAAEHPRWERVAAECLACGSCTLMCPTCFCTSTEDTCGLAGEHPRRVRTWDSCFTAAFSHLHAGSVRQSTAARYRQWVTHKLGAWTDQFGRLGCVGCGRCTTWCPAGIDLLAEVAAVRPRRRAVATAPSSRSEVPLPSEAAPAGGSPSATGADPMLPRPFRLLAHRFDTDDTVTLRLEPADGVPLEFAPGQYAMIGIRGIGEVPISISGDPLVPDVLQHTIRDVGGVTHALVRARPGDLIDVRGPYGHGWSVLDGAGGDVVIIAGGIGLAPLRPALLEAIAHRDRFAKVVVLYGARTPADILFADTLDTWRASGVDVTEIVDYGPPGYHGRVGLVTTLIPRAGFDPAGALALVCGPEAMMRPAATALVRRGVPPGRVRLSMERNMKCGVGLCGHCQIREIFVCTDGPVLPWSRLETLLAVREL
jgi:sulfhydrogenase subunit beta (sulfur reductase)